LKWRRDVAESKKLGYYTQDSGQGVVSHYFMGDDPPLEQFILRGNVWKPLPDPWYLMDMVIDGNPELR
jgi:hypothetical protein